MSDPLVIVKQGALKGAIIENIDGGEYICFSGIPYAEPPIGDLRFKVILISNNIFVWRGFSQLIKVVRSQKLDLRQK